MKHNNYDPISKYLNVKLKYCCNECAAPMKIKFNHDNGHFFLGCSNFPTCMHAEEIPESLRMELLGQQKLSGL
jgi:ssDNA-binding Zn-finger/Zn-ribbon topoisomerase 1